MSGARTRARVGEVVPQDLFNQKIPIAFRRARLLPARLVE
jgi:hypothetical protein